MLAKENIDAEPIVKILTDTQKLSALFDNLLFQTIDDIEIQKIYDEINPIHASVRDTGKAMQTLTQPGMKAISDFTSPAFNKITAPVTSAVDKFQGYLFGKNKGGKKFKKTKHVRKNKTQKRRKRSHRRR